MSWIIRKTSEVIAYRWLFRTIKIPLQVTKSMHLKTGKPLQLIVGP